MKPPRSVYASELPDGRWGVIVGEMGGKQWRTVCSDACVEGAIGAWVTDGILSRFRIWTLVASGSILESEVGHVAKTD